MCFKNTENRFGIIAQLFHWGIFALFVYMYYLALTMMDMKPSPEKWSMYGLHKSWGMVILFLVFLRISWRMMNPVPKDPEGFSKMQSLVAKAGHYALYLAMIVMPVSGYTMSMAGGHGITVFGAWKVPDLIGVDKPLGGLAHDVHEISSTVIYFLVAAHVLAALYHHFIRKDDVLKRMLPSLKKD